MPRVGNVEYLNALAQANRRAHCPFCKKWHVQDQDLITGPGVCSAVYTRNRQVAIFVRALEHGTVRKPRPAESAVAVANAWSRRPV